MRITTDEQETVIIISRNDDVAIVDTTDSTMMTKLKRLVKDNPDEWKVIHKTKLGMRVEAPKNLISLRTRTITRTFTEEQKKTMGERLQKAREQST